MSEEFFERLERNVIAKEQRRVGLPVLSFEKAIDAGMKRGVEIIIEALKEMIVGEPIRAIIEHKFHQDSTKAEMDEDTMIMAHPFKFGCDAEIWFKDHHGTDGEEVIVLAVRLS